MGKHVTFWKLQVKPGQRDALNNLMSDPSTQAQLKAAGAWVDSRNEAAVRYAGQLAHALNPPDSPPAESAQGGVDLAVLHQPLAAINVGLESLTESLKAQEAAVVQVDWRPPAGGNERLMYLVRLGAGTSTPARLGLLLGQRQSGDQHDAQDAQAGAEHPGTEARPGPRRS